MNFRRIVSRFKQAVDQVAMEFDTPEAMKKYLEEHPGADKANHSVKKHKGEGGGSGKPAGNPFMGDMKLVHKMDKAPMESEKSAKAIHRLGDQLDRATSYKGDASKVPEIKNKIREEHKKLISQAEDLDKTLDEFLAKHKDTKDEKNPGRQNTVDMVHDYAKHLKGVLDNAKKMEVDNLDFGRHRGVKDNAEKLHAGILNAASSLGMLVKPKD